MDLIPMLSALLSQILRTQDLRQKQVVIRQLIPMPAALLSCLLLFPLRGQESCQKQVGIPDRGRWQKKNALLPSTAFVGIVPLCTCA